MMQRIVTSMIIGDALGSAVEGMSKGHIRSHFKTIDDYIDPEVALKNKIDQWRKPGLYSSITQFALIMALSCPRRGPCAEHCRRAVATSPVVSGSDYGIFRYPGAAERGFITRVMDPSSSQQAIEQPCARIVPIITLLSFRSAGSGDHILDVITAVRLFTVDLSTVAAALVYSSLLRIMAAGAPPGSGPLISSIEATKHILDTIEADSAAVFGLAVNPGTLVRQLRILMDILSETASADSIQGAENIIVSRVNRNLKTPVTRATINHPSALLPYALALASLTRTPSIPLGAAVSEGGSTAALAAMTGAIGACFPDTAPAPDRLITNLVNRKRILALVDALSGAAGLPRLLEEFVDSEAALTLKEREELAARLKHSHTKPKKAPLTQADRENELTRHAVESWTKYDKARWRKERRRNDKKDDQ